MKVDLLCLHEQLDAMVLSPFVTASCFYRCCGGVGDAIPAAPGMSTAPAGVGVANVVVDAYLLGGAVVNRGEPELLLRSALLAGVVLTLGVAVLSLDVGHLKSADETSR